MLGIDVSVFGGAVEPNTGRPANDAPDQQADPRAEVSGIEEPDSVPPNPVSDFHVLPGVGNQRVTARYGTELAPSVKR